MKKADGSGAAIALIIGDDEAASSQVTLKPLRGEAAQQRVSMEQLPDALADMLYADHDASPDQASD
jgi:histidyl-tRNA synthetase